MTEKVATTEQVATETTVETTTDTEVQVEATPEVQTEQAAKVEIPAEINVTLPEGMAVDEAAFAEFKSIAQGMQLDSAKVQNLVDFYTKFQAESFEKTRQEWEKAFNADPEFGGKNAERTITGADKALQKFATPEEIDFLQATGLVSHPTLTKFFYRVHRAMSEDSLASGAASTTQGDPALVMYPTMKPR